MRAGCGPCAQLPPDLHHNLRGIDRDEVLRVRRDPDPPLSRGYTSFDEVTTDFVEALIDLPARWGAPFDWFDYDGGGAGLSSHGVVSDG